MRTIKLCEATGEVAEFLEDIKRAETSA